MVSIVRVCVCVCVCPRTLTCPGALQPSIKYVFNIFKTTHHWMEGVTAAGQGWKSRISTWPVGVVGPQFSTAVSV